MAYLGQHFPPDMLACVIVLLAMQVRDPAAQAQHAQQLAAAGQLDEAIRIYSELVRTSPGNAVLLLNLAITEYKARRFSDTVQHASAALKVQPDLLPAHLFLGAAQLELAEFASAVQELTRVVAANPQERNARLMLGEALLASGSAAEALDHFQSVASQLPDSPRVWYGLGRANAALHREPAAREAWERLNALPASLHTHLHAAEVHDQQQRWREAATEWKQALALSPDSPSITVNLAWSLFRSRDYDAAIAVLNPALKPNRADVEFLHGASLLNLQQPEAAIPHLRIALSRDAALMPARAALGQALLQTGKAEESIPLLKSALSVDTEGTIHFQLFRAYQLTHRDAEAREALAAYQRLRSR